MTQCLNSVFSLIRYFIIFIVVGNVDFRTCNYTTARDPRVILLEDMDQFEVQVFEAYHQRGFPRVVVNYAGL